MNQQTQRLAGWLIAIAGLIALVTPSLKSQSSSSNQQPESFQRSFNITPGGTLQVDNYKGTIHVTGSDNNQVVVDVTKRFEGNDADRKWWMENVEINFHNSNDRVAVEVKYPESYKPDIKVASVQGDIRIKSYKSPITIDSTTGSIRVDTYKDTVKLNNVTVRGPLEIKSYKADAEVNAKALGETATLENEKGTIVLRVPQNAGLDVDYEGGRRSDFHSDFPLNMQSGSVDHSIHGTVNQGGTKLRLRTGKGSVSLEKLSG